MDTAPPPQPPYGSLIEITRKGARLPIQGAADRARVSKATWIDNVRGYRKRDGRWEHVDPKPETIAGMAGAVGLSPERLEADGQRPDAAEILREILRQQADSRAAAPQPAPPRRERRLRALEDSDEPGLQPHLQDVRRELYTAAGIIGMFPPGADLPGPEDLPELVPLLEALPGDVAFPDSTTEPAVWETRDRLSVPERIRLVARIRHMAAKHAGGQRDRRVSGLTSAWHGNGATGAVPVARYQAGIT